jgi:carboxyl-terminal processing protease
MPDVFVPADTAHRTVLIQELSNQQLFSAYVIDRLQPSLKKYPSEDDFLKQYSVNDQELGDFIMYASQTIKEMDSRELLISKPYLKTLLKSFAARFNWGDNAFYKSLNADDPVLRKGIEAVK